MTEQMDSEIAKAIVEVMGGVDKLAKESHNKHGGYKFAGIDDFLSLVNTLGYDATQLRPVASYELQEVVGITKVLQLKHARDEWHQIKRDMDRMGRKKEPVPEYLKNRLFELEALIKKLGG